MSDLKKAIENYDNTKSLNWNLVSFKDLVKNPELLKKHISEFKNNPRIKALKEIFDSVINKIKADGKEIFERFNVDIQLTASNMLSEPIMNAIDFNFEKTSGNTNLEVTVNFNFVKLAMLPGPEAYACIYHKLFEAILKKKQAMSNSNEDYKFGNNLEAEEIEPVVNDAHFDRQGNYVAPKNIILEYIKKFLRAVLGSEYGEDYQSAKEISNEIMQAGISPQELFENPNGINLLAERYANVSKKGASEQANFLLGVFSKEEFENLKNNNPSEIKAFCEKFARNFLKNSGLDESLYRITYNRVDSKGNILSAGTYNDFGRQGQTININLSEMERMNNPAEIVMTLSHELTHMVDSAVNKKDGNVVGKGYGLTDNLVGGTGEIEKFRNSVPADTFSFLKELETICYRINPNEVSARQGELVALEFMERLQVGDKEMLDKINESKAGYDSYVVKINNAVEKAVEMRAEFDKIKDSIQNPEVKKFIESRLDYIDLLKSKGRLNQIPTRGQSKQGRTQNGFSSENEIINAGVMGMN